MKYILTIASIFLYSSVFSQNLIPNPGFEQHIECPTDQGSGSVNGGGYFPVVDWDDVRYSADYYNECATNNLVSVPSSFQGYQVPYDGDAYIGFYAYSMPGDLKEFIGTQFTALEVDTEYVMTIHVSATSNNGYYNYAVDGLGVFFTTYGQPATTWSWSNIPQVDYTNFGIISDTLNWITLTDTFVADSAYQYLVIGDHKHPDSINKVLIGPNPNNHMSYYFIDGVSLVKLSQTTSVNDLKSLNSVPSIYPNPITSSSVITFPNKGHEAFTLKIYDIAGRMVQQVNNISGTKVQLERGRLVSGIYSYTLTGSQDEMYRGKFIVN